MGLAQRSGSEIGRVIEELEIDGPVNRTRGMKKVGADRDGDFATTTANHDRGLIVDVGGSAEVHSLERTEVGGWIDSGHGVLHGACGRTGDKASAREWLQSGYAGVKA
jgi:hypothetical protein